MVRVSVRRVGSLTGKLAAAPESLAALLALATKKLKLDKPASRIFTASGDELDDDDDVLLLREDDVVLLGLPWGRGRRGSGGSVGRSRTSRTRGPKKSVGRWGVSRTVHRERL